MPASCGQEEHLQRQKKELLRELLGFYQQVFMQALLRVSSLKWMQRAQLEVVFQVSVHSTTPNAKCTCLAQPFRELIKKPHTPSRVCFSNRLEFQGDFCLELTHNTQGCFSTALHLHRVQKQTEAVPAGEILQILHLHKAQNPRCCKPHMSWCGNLLWKVQEI